MRKILVIQTAFIGDVVLATAILEKLHAHFPNAKLDLMVRKGNESLLDGHPFINELLVWDKKNNKYRRLFRLLKRVRKSKYDLVVNLQRFLATGLLTAFSGADYKVGFSKNPMSFLFSKSYPHKIGDRKKTIHEIDRNQCLIAEITDDQRYKPRLYPPTNLPGSFYPQGKYITISPGSVWYTKQYPSSKWIGFLNEIQDDIKVVLLGGKDDAQLCKHILTRTKHVQVEIKAGQLTLLESAALMQKAYMNFANDSAPTHLASAVNAPITTVFCSTVPSFGFTPLSDKSAVVETNKNLPCRPCNLHGQKACPKKHFKCTEFSLDLLLERLS